MEIRLNGKGNPPNYGYKSLSAWIAKTKDDREILVLMLGELKITIHPFDRNTIANLGRKLVELGGQNI